MSLAGRGLRTPLPGPRRTPEKWTSHPGPSFPFWIASVRPGLALDRRPLMGTASSENLPVLVDHFLDAYVASAVAVGSSCSSWLVGAETPDRPDSVNATLGVRPQPLEVVVITLFLVEDVNRKVDVVQNHPAGFPVALSPTWLHSV